MIGVKKSYQNNLSPLITDIRLVAFLRNKQLDLNYKLYTMKQMRNLFSAILVLSVSLLILSCNDGNSPVDNDYILSGNANGSQEVPPVTTSATGVLTGTYNRDNNTFQYSITWTGLSGTVTAMHFHGPAVVGASAPPIHDIFSQIITNGTSGSAGGSLTLHDTTEAHLLNGKLYYNIHTAANSNGEIRGQVIASQ